MVIRNIGRMEFIRHLSPHGDLEHFIGKEVEWFSAKTGNIIGTIAQGDESRGWNYVILRRNRTGKFAVSNVVCDFYSHAAARVDFMFAMVGAGQKRRVQFPEQPAATTGRGEQCHHPTQRKTHLPWRISQTAPACVTG